MDPENIASILKDAITASTAKIQSESKHTSVFVLPPEILEGILKNDTSKVNDTTSVPSKSKESKKAKKNKSPSLEDSKSTNLPNDRPKRTSNRRCTTSKSPKCTRSQKSSKNNSTGLASEEQSTNNSTGLASEEQNHEQTTLLDNYEIPEAFTSTENIAVQNELNGGKDEIIAESELADLYNAETILDTILDTVQENIEIGHEVEVCSESEIFDKLLDNSKTEQNAIPISEKIEEECIESIHELQNCPNNETTDNIIETDNSTSIAGIKTLNDVDCETEVNDHTLQNSGIEISKVDASQKISNKEISAEVKLDNESTEEITIIEEMYIVEEIIEFVEEEEDNMYTKNNEVNKLEVENIKVEDSLHEMVDFPEPNNQPSNIKPTSTSKKAPIFFKPIVEQKRPITTKVYANKRKNKIQACINEIEDQTLQCESHALREFRKEIHFETNYNFDCHGSSDTVVTETPVVKSYEDLEFLGFQEKSNLEVECYPDQNSLAEDALIEQQFHETKDLQQAPMHFDLETNCWFDEDISYTKLLETYNEDSCVEPRQRAETVSTLENTSNENVDSNLVNEIVENAKDRIEAKEEIESTEGDFCTWLKNEETTSGLEETGNEEKSSNFVDELVENTQVHIEAKEEIESTEGDFCTWLKNQETISRLEKTGNKEKAPNVVVELVENAKDHIEAKEEIESTKGDFCTVLKQNEETISGLEKSGNEEKAPNFVVELVENTQVHKEREKETESTKEDFCTVLKQSEETISGLEKTGNEEKAPNFVVELVENTQDQPETREEILSTNSFQKTNDTHEKLVDQTKDLKVKVYNTRTRRKSANTTMNEKNSVETVQTVQSELKTNAESTESTRLDDSAKHSTESNVNNIVEDNTDNSNSKSETNSLCKNHDLDKSRDNWKNGDDCSIKSLRQLRNRTKVIPIDLINFNKLQNSVAKESLHLKNVDKGDVALKNNIEVSNRTRSKSLHFELNSPETLSIRAKKLSRKPMSVDKCLLNKNRISTLRRRSVVPENEIKVEPILEDSGSKETNKTADDGKCPTEAEETMRPESNLNENSSCSTGDSRNSDHPMKIAINRRRSSLKPKKVIVVEKIEKERSSRSSQTKDDLSVTADLDKRDTESNEIGGNSQITDTAASLENTENNDVQMDTPETDSNKVLLKNNEDGEPNCNSEESHCEMNISIGKLLENVFKVKTENVIPVKKFRRGRSAKFTPSDETTAGNMGRVPGIDKNQIIGQLHAEDNLINHGENVTATNSQKHENANLLEDSYNKTLEASSFDTSNHQVENALKDNPIKIKTEKIIPVRRGRRGRSLKSLQSNEISTENTESAVDCHQSESEFVSNDCEKLVATATSVDTSNGECQLDNAMEEGTLKIKTEKITPVRRGRRGRSLKSMPPNEINTKNTESAFESHQSKNTTESIDSGELMAKADPVNMSDAEFQVDDAFGEDILQMKTEMITPIKRYGRGKSSNFIISHEITAENAESAADSQKTEKTTESIDSKKLVPTVNPVDTSNAECQVENAAEEGSLEIKTEKVTPARRGRRGRSSKSIPSNGIIKENTENPVDRNQSESESASIGCEELLATVNLVDTPNAECQKDNGMEKNSLKIKTEKVTPIRRGSRGRRLQSIPSNEITAENIETASDSHQSESAAESIDGGELVATVKPVDTSNVECHVDNALGEASIKIKTEKITPVKIGRRGRSSKSILSNQNTTENAESDFDIPQSESAAESIDSGKLVGAANPVDTANVECPVDNALEEDILNIKTEMITPVRRGGRGRSSKFVVSNEIIEGNAEIAVDTQQSENMTESIDSEKLTATLKPVDTSNAECQVDNALERDIPKIKTEKITPIRRGRKGRRSTPILSSIVKTEKTKDNVDIDTNSQELDSADSLDRDEAPVNNCTTTCDEKDENNTILSTDNLKLKLESSSIDESIASLPVENASTESGLKIKTEKAPPLKRGRRGWRSKSKPSINLKSEEHYDVNWVSTDEFTEDFPTIDSTIADNDAASNNVKKNTDEERSSNDLNEKSESDLTELLNVNSETVYPQNDAKSTKKGKGRRGRGSKSSQLKDTVEEKETMADDCVVPHIENNAEIETDNVSQFEDASDYPESIGIHMEVDSTTEDNNITHDDSLDTIGINNQIKEEPEKSTSGSSRRSSRTSRHIKQEPTSFDTSDIETSSKNNIEQTMPRSRRSSKINTQRNTIDDGDKAKDKDSSNLEVRNSRRSGRHLKSKVNYRAPDEDVDVFASETQARQQSSENAPKKRRGRPSRAEMLKSVAPAVEKVKESPQESIQNDTNLDTSVDDSDTPLADRSNTLTKRRRTAKRSAVNEDIFEVGSKPSIEEQSLDTESDHTNDFDDNHFSGGLEDEEVIEDPIPSRGRKRKYVFKGYKARKRGRPKRGVKDEVESNDEDYTPHHSYVPHPPKVQEKPKTIPGKKMVKCGKCEKEIAKHQWNSHNLYRHNDMGWISGTEKPDFENDQKLLFRVLTIAHKKKNKRGLLCETCREVKRSVVGFTSHIMFCGKTEAEMASLLVTCEICGSKLKPSSMEYHERTHRLEVVKKQKQQEKAETIIDIFEPRSKRKAAEKAVSKISEFTALVKDEDGFSSSKKMKMSSLHINKLIQKPQTTKRISSITIAKWKKELENNQDAACTQLGCQFTCKSLEEMREHYSSCNFTATQNYVCKICNYQTASENEIIKHANEKHAPEDLDINASVSGSEACSDDDDDYSDVDEDSSNQGQGGSGKKFIYKEASEVENKLFKFVFENTLCLSIQNKTPLSAFQWTLEFERKHFKFGLFENFLPNAFTLLEEENAKDYLPRLDSSMPVRFTKKDGVSNSSEWKNWDRFEACRVDDSPTFFVGGPVWAMAWAPTPSYLAISNDLPQFLAISTHPTMDSEYAVGKSYSGKNIIQIWNLGKLNNRTLSESDPALSYAITHDGGTVWSLEWCPSGCYQHEDFSILNGGNNSNRLGLLAAGCSDGCVRIYSLIFPDDLHLPDKNQYPIYNTEIVAQLILNTEVHERKSESWQVFRICWSREANHNVIVAGFSNGYVAFWDLTTKSPMLKYQVGNTTFFRPYKQFFAHHHAVTMLKLVPGGNKRYLATASLDKLFKFWDLEEDTARPKNTFKKSYVTDGSWFNNWCCAVIAHDEALCMGHNTTVCIALRDYTYKYYNLLPSNSTTFAIDTSDFANGIATGNVAGELLALFPQQLMYIREMERTLNSKRSFSVISTAELVDFKPVPDNNPPVKKDKKSKKNDPYKDPAYFQPSTYEESKDRFGIQFNNNMSVFQTNSKKTRKPQKKQSLTCEHLERTPMEQYPLKSINKLAWNPNASSFLWLAAGYQNGFVRLISFRSAASTLEWNKLLQSHTNALKAQKAE